MSAILGLASVRLQTSIEQKEEANECVEERDRAVKGRGNSEKLMNKSWALDPQPASKRLLLIDNNGTPCFRNPRTDELNIRKMPDKHQQYFKELTEQYKGIRSEHCSKRIGPLKRISPISKFRALTQRLDHGPPKVTPPAVGHKHHDEGGQH
ncbi:hypothetical protein scyTo_0005877 [Scyliorhinus torazame]|uniref:Uncharacterized protein n=1 Tax=Scyliorhinus torazame TaxID=75743 RepID=A0A401PDL3_SCYTO|nr:hypothetical protein [Scyliorhinus torazame]